MNSSQTHGYKRLISYLMLMCIFQAHLRTKWYISKALLLRAVYGTHNGKQRECTLANASSHRFMMYVLLCVDCLLRVHPVTYAQLHSY